MRLFLDLYSELTSITNKSWKISNHYGEVAFQFGFQNLALNIFQNTLKKCEEAEGKIIISENLENCLNSLVSKWHFKMYAINIT